MTLCDLGENCKLRTLLGESGKLVAKAESLVVDSVTALKEGLVKVSDLQFLKEHSDRFFDLCKLRDSHHSGQKIFSAAQTYLSHYSGQLELFEKERHILLNFVHFCMLVSASEDLVQLCLSIKGDVSDLEVRNLVQQDICQSAVVSCFSMLSTYRQYVELIWKGSKSFIFRMLWNETGNEVARSRSDKQPPLSLVEIVEMICEPLYHQWQSICDKVGNGSILLERVSVLFYSPATEIADFDQELDCIADFCAQQENADWKQQRRKQIEQYGKLRNLIEAAHALKLVMSTLKIPQAFQEINDICSQVSLFICDRLQRLWMHHQLCCLQDSPDFRLQPIRMFTDDFLFAVDFLASLTSKDIACLKSFTDSPNLVLWLRQDIKGKQV